MNEIYRIFGYKIVKTNYFNGWYDYGFINIRDRGLLEHYYIPDFSIWHVKLRFKGLHKI